MNSNAPRSTYKFYTSTSDAWEAMIRACENASHSIHFEEYILEPDMIGKRFMHALETKARQGVKVKLLLDWWGCIKLYLSKYPKRLKDAGVCVKFYRKPKFSWLGSPKEFFPRDHRKLLILDDSKAFVGGVCVYDKITHWRDTMVELEGMPVTELNQFFHQTFKQADGAKAQVSITHRHHEPQSFAVVANSIHTKDSDFSDLLLEKIDAAEDCIYMTTPYFVPSDAYMDALKHAATRGVKVKLLISSYSRYVPHIIGRLITKEMIEAGIHIYYYNPHMLHLKMMIIDKQWAAIGSHNLDGLSIKQNEEIMLTSIEQDFVNTLLTHFREDLHQSERYTLEDWQDRSWFEHILATVLYKFKEYA